MQNYLGISDQAYALGREAERKIAPYFARLEEICDRNTEKVLGAFRNHRVSDTMFAGTTGYGYDDHGRDTLDKIYAEIFGTEAALVRIGFVNGTHTLSCAMFSAVQTGDVVLSVTSEPYDTLMNTITGEAALVRIGFVNGTHTLSCAMFSAVQTGDVVLSVTSEPYDTLMNTITGDCAGSMKRYGIGYRQVDLKDGLPDLPEIAKAAADPAIKLVFIQRSRGYAVRQTLSCEQIGEICRTVRAVNPDAVIMVDNCYGEFTETIEPTQVGYAVRQTLSCEQIGEICRTVRAVNPDAVIMVDNCYGEFTETIEPTQVGADLCAGSLIKNPGGGLAPTGGYIAGRADLIENAAYRPVIMAAGAFVQGASIELSADAPMREPYVCYMQGGLTYSSGKAGILLAAEKLMKELKL